MSAWLKNQHKNLNILRTKRDFRIKQKAFFIIFKVLSLKQMKRFFGRWESEFKGCEMKRFALKYLYFYATDNLFFWLACEIYLCNFSESGTSLNTVIWEHIYKKRQLILIKFEGWILKNGTTKVVLFLKQLCFGWC